MDEINLSKWNNSFKCFCEMLTSSFFCRSLDSLSPNGLITIENYLSDVIHRARLGSIRLLNLDIYKIFYKDSKTLLVGINLKEDLILYCKFKHSSFTAEPICRDAFDRKCVFLTEISYSIENGVYNLGVGGTGSKTKAVR